MNGPTIEEEGRRIVVENQDCAPRQLAGETRRDDNPPKEVINHDWFA